MHWRVCEAISIYTSKVLFPGENMKYIHKIPKAWNWSVVRGIHLTCNYHTNDLTLPLERHNRKAFTLSSGNDKSQWDPNRPRLGVRERAKLAVPVLGWMALLYPLSIRATLDNHWHVWDHVLYVNKRAVSTFLWVCEIAWAAVWRHALIGLRENILTPVFGEG